MSQEKSFEASYKRLEEILEKMQEGAIPLEESLKLYEEADRLIGSCEKLLLSAEERIETLMKNRAGELSLTAEGKPQTQPFVPTQAAPLQS